MERKTLIILTKSSKYHGNCVTGIDTETGKWVRLMTHDEQSQGAVPDILLSYADGKPLEVMDTVSAPIEEWCGDRIHPENYYLDEDYYFQKLGNASFSEVLELHPGEDRKYIYNNTLSFVDLDHIDYIDYSLCLVKVTNLALYEQSYSFGKKKWKASFTYNGNDYKGVAMTDPKFYHSVSGTMYKEAYVVISIGTPWEGKYYKYLSAIFVKKNTMVLPEQNKTEEEHVDLMEINVEAHSGNGMAIFSNFDAFKQELIKQLSVFKTETYTVESMRDAVSDRDMLKKLKNKLTEKRKEIDRISNQPFEIVKEQLDELINLVKEPYKIIDDYIKEQEKRVKRDEIYAYARDKASALGDLSDELIESRSFFNPRWLNASYSKGKWQKDINEIVLNAKRDITKIAEFPEEIIPVARTQYFDTLSIISVESFIKNLTTAKERNKDKPSVLSPVSTVPQNSSKPQNDEKNSAVFKVVGTKEQINNRYRLLRQVGLAVEILSKE